MVVSVFHDGFTAGWAWFRGIGGIFGVDIIGFKYFIDGLSRDVIPGCDFRYGFQIQE